MKAVRKLLAGVALGACLLVATGCTALGAGTGAVAGAAASNGNPAATVGGAVVGGVIGHELGK